MLRIADSAGGAVVGTIAITTDTGAEIRKNDAGTTDKLAETDNG